MSLKELINIGRISGDKECERKRPNMFIIWIIIGAILILTFGGFGSEKDNVEKPQESVKTVLYEAEQEERLAKILKKINGAGDVAVYIRLDDGGEAVTAKNEKYLSEEKDGSKRKESEDEVVISDKEKEPYVTKIREPQISGVLVVASGAADEYIKLKIYEAVKALYGISPHRIQVTY